MKFIKTIIVALSVATAGSAFAQFSTGGKSGGIDFSESTLKTGYKGYVDLGYGIGVGDFDEGRIEFSTTHGYQILPYLYTGVGVGFNYFHGAESYNIPIFADFRGSYPVPDSRLAPFIDMRLGYSAGDIDGFYFSPSVGIRIATSEKCGLNIGLGYEMQKCDVYYLWDYGVIEDTGNAGALTIKLGLDF